VPPHSRISVEELLLRHRAINEDQLERARQEQQRLGGDVGRILVDLGYVSEDLLLRTQAHQLGIPIVDPVKNPPSAASIQSLPVQLAEQFQVIPIGGSTAAGMLRIATSAPGDATAIEELAILTGCKIELAAAPATRIEAAIRTAYYAQPAKAEPKLDELQELRARLDRTEKQLSNREYAAALARIDRLEQIAEHDERALKVLGEVLIETGAIERDELKRRLSRS